MPDPGGGTICRRCGLRATEAHVDVDECIDGLRDHIARLQFRAERKIDQPGVPSRRGGWRQRADNRFVLLDGERLVLAEAAHRLGLSTSALHWRLVGRCGKDYREPDVRGVGADKVRREPIQKVL